MNNERDMRLLELAVQLCDHWGTYVTSEGKPTERENGVDARTHLLRRAGCTKEQANSSTIPQNLDAIFFVRGVEFELITTEVARKQRPGSRRAHRLFCICPVCRKMIPVGRMHQHQSVHWDAMNFYSAGRIPKPYGREGETVDAFAASITDELKTRRDCIRMAKRNHKRAVFVKS